MTDQVECLRCRTSMEPGFVIDVTSGSYTQQRWGPGARKVSRWWGLIVDRKTLIPVTTLRCPRCGALESYASPTPPPRGGR